MKVNSSLNVSTEKISGNLNVVDPNFNFSGNSLSAGFNISSTDRSSTTGYKSSSTGFSLGTGFEQWESVYFSPSIDVTHEDIETDSTASSNLKTMEGTYFNTDFIYAITKDMRNQKFQPTEGYVMTFKQSLPIIQDKSSISNAFQLNKYKEISDNVIGSIRYRAAMITGVDGDVRLTNRLYMGSREVRGFVKGKMGPKDGSDYIGGNYKTSISIDAQLPNLLPESYNTDFNLFLDAGNVWGVDYGKKTDSSKIRSTVGIGANLFTPVGPLSFIFSQALAKKDTDQTETFSFNLGTSF
jgi:outer membrane protein insertion porin family